MNPYEYLNSINYTKKDIMVDDIAESKYNGFLINRSLSYFPDTVMFANEMNRWHHLDNRLAFDFYINTIRKRKRFSKWIKPEKENDIDVIKEYYGYSNEKARQALSILSPETIKIIKDKVDKGGRGKR